MNKQSFITILLPILMSMTGAKVFAHDIEVKNADGKTIYYHWIKNNTELSVCHRDPNINGFVSGYTGNLVIPESVEYYGKNYPVTSIGVKAFFGSKALTSVTIPNSVTYIGENAPFQYCPELISIKVESGNTKYDSRDNCNAIIETSSNTLIGGCKKTFIPNSVTSIGDYAFYGCSGLTSVTIPNSVTSIGERAFYDCSGLATIVSEIKNAF